MPTITVKDIPEDLYAALKKRAAAHHRSVNREIIHYIEQAVRGRDVNVEDALAKAREIRQRVGKVPFSQELIQEYKDSERS